MSSARKRRADIQANPPAPNKMVPPPVPGRNTTSNNVPSSNGLTLQQVIHITDKRLTALENSIQKGIGSSAQSTPSLDKDIVNEIYSRFDILLSEVADLKDTVMKLQTYTMDVNRVLFEERSKRSDDNDDEDDEDDDDNNASADATAAAADAGSDEKEENNSETTTVVENTTVIKTDEPVEETTTNKRRGGGGGARRVRGGGIRVNL